MSRASDGIFKALSGHHTRLAHLPLFYHPLCSMFFFSSLIVFPWCISLLFFLLSFFFYSVCVHLEIHMLKPDPRPHPQVAVFGDGALREVIKLTEVLRMRPYSGMTGVLIRRDTNELASPDTHRQSPCEDLARRWPSANQEESPQQKLNLMAPGTWTSSLRNCREINFCC